MHIVETTRLPWDLIVPNTRGGDIWRKQIRGAEGGRQVSYDVRIERFGEGDRVHVFLDRTEGFHLQEDVSKPMIFVPISVEYFCNKALAIASTSSPRSRSGGIRMISTPRR